MNRIFHARIAAGQYLFLLITTAITIHEMWMKHAIMTILFMLLLIIAIERLIHTTYTLTTDDKLILFYVKYGTKEKCAVLLPVKEDLFIKTLTNRLSEVKKY